MSKSTASFIILLAIAFTLTKGCGITHIKESQYDVIVTHKERTRHRYLIYTKLLRTNQTRVFENTDSPLLFKFDSSDVYERITVNKKYRFTVYGWRVAILSLYENISDYMLLD